MAPAGYTLLYDSVFQAVDSSPAGMGPGLTYRTSFYKKGYQGAVTRLKAGGSPVKADMSGDALFGQKPRKVTVEVIATATVSLANFYANTDRDIFVIVDVIDNRTEALVSTYFNGWVSVFDSSEPYQAAPYPVSVTANDGLGTLTDYPFYRYPLDSNTSGTIHPFQGTVTLLEALQQALRWAGYYAPVWTNYHVAEEADWGSPNVFGILPPPSLQYDYLAHVAVPVARWQNADGTWMSCKQVIDDILGVACRLVQVNGNWQFDYMPDLPGTPDPNGVYKLYYNTYSYNGATTATGYAVVESTIILYKKEKAIPLMGSTLATLQPILRYKMTFDYGPKQDILQNGAMIGVVGANVPGWTGRFYNPASGKVVGGTDDDHPFAVRIFDLKNGDPKRAYTTGYQHESYLFQDVFVPVSLTAPAPKFIISGNYLNRGTGGSAIQVNLVYGIIRSGAFIESLSVNPSAIPNIHFLQTDGSWKNVKSSGGYDLFIHDLNLQPDALRGVKFPNGKDAFVVKPTKGETFTHESQAIPTPGLFTGRELPEVIKVSVQLLSGPDFDSRDAHTGDNGGNCYTDYWNIKLQIAEASVAEITKEIIYAEVTGLTPKDRKKTIDLSVNLGYQTTAYASPPKALRPGGELRADGVTRTGRCLTLNGHIDKIQNLNLRGRLEYTRAPRKLFDGDVLGEPTPNTVLIGQEIGGHYFLPATHTHDLRARTVKTRLQEMPTALDKLSDAVFSGDYQTADGALYPMGADVQSKTTVAVTPILSRPGIRYQPLPPDILKKIGQIATDPAGAVVLSPLPPAGSGVEPVISGGEVLLTNLPQQ